MNENKTTGLNPWYPRRRRLGASLQPQKHNRAGNGRGDGLDEEDLAVGGQAAVGARDAHAAEEEELDLLGDLGRRVGEGPDEARGQEAVVEPLVRRERLGFLGEVGLEAERLVPARRRPEEHLQDQDVAVQAGHEARRGGGEDGHGEGEKTRRRGWGGN